MPFFEAKLREEWSGTTSWNLHNKMRLQLPCLFKKEALEAFLTYVYGDARSLYRIEPWAAPLLQVSPDFAPASFGQPAVLCGPPIECSGVHSGFCLFCAVLWGSCALLYYTHALGLYVRLSQGQPPCSRQVVRSAPASP